MLKKILKNFASTGEVILNKVAFSIDVINYSICVRSFLCYFWIESHSNLVRRKVNKSKISIVQIVQNSGKQLTFSRRKLFSCLFVSRVQKIFQIILLCKTSNQSSIFLLSQGPKFQWGRKKYQNLFLFVKSRNFSNSQTKSKFPKIL